MKSGEATSERRRSSLSSHSTADKYRSIEKALKTKIAKKSKEIELITACLNWNAVSAIATAAAATVALCVWLFSLAKDKKTTRKQIAISRYLLIEEMARVSSAALAIWKYCGDPIPDTSFTARYRELDEMLRTHRAESLISKVADLPDDLCIALARFISEANMLSTALASICRGMEMKKVHQYPKGHEVNEGLIVRSGELLVCAQDLAKLLEREVCANEGDVTSEVAKLPEK